MQGLPAADSAAPDALFAPDPYALTGPSPAFEANVLDAERDLKTVLARLELARSQAELRRSDQHEDVAAARNGTAERAADRDAAQSKQCSSARVA
jgi:hypothetical protein